LIPKAGYSGKSLPDKLGFKPGMTALFVRLPETLAELAGAVAFAKTDKRDGWAKVSGAGRYDLIHAFTTSRRELEAGLPRLQAALKRDGMIWVSWPKKAAKVATDVTEDVVRETALKGDLVDVKVAAVDEVWSGLKLVIRKERR
jgi:hypothetical protein